MTHALVNEVQCATIYTVMSPHISDDQLELYHLGKVTDESELAVLEEHLLACPGDCVERAEEVANRIDAIRAAIIECEFDRQVSRK